jgi:hypothetical protein
MKLLNQMWGSIGFASGVSAMAFFHWQGATQSDLALTIGAWGMVAFIWVLLAMADLTKA